MHLRLLRDFVWKEKNGSLAQSHQVINDGNIRLTIQKRLQFIQKNKGKKRKGLLFFIITELIKIQISIC